MIKTSKTNVTPKRQPNQYSCTTTSLSMALEALGIPHEECQVAQVNKVLGAQPLQGASWDQVAGAASHFGCRTTLIVPATLDRVRKWTDAGTPVLIGWNTGNEWGHASLIFDVDDKHVHIADPNLPNPSECVTILTHNDFYARWWEKSSQGYKIRRPAMAVELEVSPEGRQMVASNRSAGDHENLKHKNLRAYWEFNSNVERYYGVVDEDDTEVGGVTFLKKSGTWVPHLGDNPIHRNLTKFTASDPREGIQKSLMLIHEALGREGVQGTPDLQDLYRQKDRPMKISEMISRVADAYESDRESAKKRDPYKIDMSNAPKPTTRLGPDAVLLQRRRTRFDDSQAYQDAKGYGNPKHKKNLRDQE